MKKLQGGMFQKQRYGNKSMCIDMGFSPCSVVAGRVLQDSDL